MKRKLRRGKSTKILNKHSFFVNKLLFQIDSDAYTEDVASMKLIPKTNTEIKEWIYVFSNFLFADFVFSASTSIQKYILDPAANVYSAK